MTTFMLQEIHILLFRHIKIKTLKSPIWKSDKLQAYHTRKKVDGDGKRNWRFYCSKQQLPQFHHATQEVALECSCTFTQSLSFSYIKNIFSPSVLTCACVSYPAGLVTDEADEQWGQFRAPHLWRGGVGDHHEALSTGFPDAPKAVWAQVKELGHLC